MNLARHTSSDRSPLSIILQIIRKFPHVRDKNSSKSLDFTVEWFPAKPIKSGQNFWGDSMSFELTPDDLLILETHRLARFRSLFAKTLTFCILQFDPKNTLTIHCSEAWMVDYLLNRLGQLRWYAWTVTGAHYLSIYFYQEEIYKTTTCRPDQPSQKIPQS